MRELSVAEQRYQAVLAVISDGEITQNREWSSTPVSALARNVVEPLEGLGDGSHRPRSCPHQISSSVEVEIARMRHSHPSWGPKRLVFELERAGVLPAGVGLPSESAVYRALKRLNLIDPAGRRRRDRKWKRWERGEPMELWQLDTVGGFVIAKGSTTFRAKALTGVDDHSRFCVSAYLMTRESSQRVCDGLALALRRWGVPGQILTDNGKVFTGRFNRPPVEVLFDRVCRENGIEHLLTQPRSPTTTGKIERFHRALRAEFRTDRVFTSLRAAQAELDEWVDDYNTNRPHQALDMATPASRFWRAQPAAVTAIRAATPEANGRPGEDRTDGTWVARRATAVGVVCVSWQLVCLGVAAAGRPIEVWVTDNVLQFYDGDTLLRTEARTSTGEVRRKRAQTPGGRRRVQTSVTDQPK
jgi:transposase InsO family protein